MKHTLLQRISGTQTFQILRHKKELISDRKSVTLYIGIELSVFEDPLNETGCRIFDYYYFINLSDICPITKRDFSKLSPDISWKLFSVFFMIRKAYSHQKHKFLVTKEPVLSGKGPVLLAKRSCSFVEKVLFFSGL